MCWSLWTTEEFQVFCFLFGRSLVLQLKPLSVHSALLCAQSFLPGFLLFKPLQHTGWNVNTDSCSLSYLLPFSVTKYFYKLRGKIKKQAQGAPELSTQTRLAFRAHQRLNIFWPYCAFCEKPNFMDTDGSYLKEKKTGERGCLPLAWKSE